MLTQILDLSKKLMYIPSSAENQQALFDVLEEAKKYLDGFTIEEFERNGKPSLLAYVGEKRPEKFTLLLNAHLDVVPGKPDQYKPFEKDGKLFGRGAYDMKAAAAAEILLFKELAKKVSYPLGLQLVTDEEIGGAHGTEYQLEQGVYTDFIIAGENTDLKIKNQAKGILWLKFSAKGKTGHGAYPWQGDNALWKIVETVKNLEKTFPHPTTPSWQTTMNLSKIETTNATFNKIPEDATAWIDIRFIPEEKDTIHQKVKNLIPEAFTVEFAQDQPAACTPENNPFLQKLAQVTEKITGKAPEVVSGHGAADVRFYTHTGSAGVEFGLLGANHHADEEWVDIQSLETYYAIMKDFILSL